MINKQRPIHVIAARTMVPGIFLCLGLLLAGCKNDMKEVAALVSKTSAQEDKAWDVTILYSSEGKVKTKLFAKEFVRNEAARPPYTDARNGLKIIFYNDSLGVENTLTAEYGRWYEAQGNILLRKNVVIVNKKGERLNTEELIWNQNAGKFYTEKFVRITTPTQTMYGDGLEANQDFSYRKITNLRGIIRVNKNEVPTE